MDYFVNGCCEGSITFNMCSWSEVFMTDTLFAAVCTCTAALTVVETVHARRIIVALL